MRGAIDLLGGRGGAMKKTAVFLAAATLLGFAATTRAESVRIGVIAEISAAEAFAPLRYLSISLSIIGGITALDAATGANGLSSSSVNQASASQTARCAAGRAWTRHHAAPTISPVTQPTACDNDSACPLMKSLPSAASATSPTRLRTTAASASRLRTER